MVDQVVIGSEENNPTLEEQAAAMDAAAAKNETPDDGKILGKFTSQDDLEKAYQELESRNSKLSQELADLKKTEVAEEPVPEEEPDPSDEPEDDNDAAKKAAEEAADNAGLDLEVMRDYYEENGELSDEHYKALAEKAHLPREIVDEFIAGQEARAAIIEQRAFEAAGGEEQYRAMGAWARENLSAEEVAMIDAEVLSGNEQRTLFAISNLRARYERDNGFEPSKSVTGGGKGGSLDKYENWEQVRVDMSKPEYKTDPAYQEKVKRKIERSNI